VKTPVFDACKRCGWWSAERSKSVARASCMLTGELHWFDDCCDEFAEIPYFIGMTFDEAEADAIAYKARAL